MNYLRSLIVLTYVTTSSAALGQVSGWRGDGSGRWPQAETPIIWDGSSAKNILWETAIGKGNSCPVIAGDKAFVTAEPDKLRCVDVRDGKIMWSLENSFVALKLTAPEKLSEPAPGCGFSTPTPVTDGKFVYACYGSGIVICCDVDGQRRWARHLDLPQHTQYGHSASPVLAGGTLLVSHSHLAALDPATGKTLWECPDAKPTYGTPAITRIGQTEVAITPAGACVRLSDGKVLVAKLAEALYCSPLVQGGVVYFAGEPAVAIKLPETMEGAFTPRVLWKAKETEGKFFASPLLHEGILYLVNNEGVLYAVEAASGKLVFQKELPIRSSLPPPDKDPANIYPSLVLIGKRLMVMNDVGETLVLQPGRTFKELALNQMLKGSGASAAATGRRLLLRGGAKLYCIGTAEKP